MHLKFHGRGMGVGFSFLLITLIEKKTVLRRQAMRKIISGKHVADLIRDKSLKHIRDRDEYVDDKGCYMMYASLATCYWQASSSVTKPCATTCAYGVRTGVQDDAYSRRRRVIRTQLTIDT